MDSKEFWTSLLKDLTRSTSASSRSVEDVLEHTRAICEKWRPLLDRYRRATAAGVSLAPETPYRVPPFPQLQVIDELLAAADDHTSGTGQ
jgi:hypothetical protein